MKDTFKLKARVLAVTGEDQIRIWIVPIEPVRSVRPCKVNVTVKRRVIANFEIEGTARLNPHRTDLFILLANRKAMVESGNDVERLLRLTKENKAVLESV